MKSVRGNQSRPSQNPGHNHSAATSTPGRNAKLPLSAAKNNGALIVTCIRGRERRAMTEILQVLNETPTVKAWRQSMKDAVPATGGGNDVGSSSEGARDDAGSNDIAAALAAELKELKGETGGARRGEKKDAAMLANKDAFRELDVGKGVVGGGLVALLCNDQGLDPVQIARDVFQQLCDPRSLAQVTK
jgi:hypothetical protein